MDKLKMHSPDITQQNIDKLLELFPNCKTEKQGDNGELSIGVDFDLLKQELSKNIVEGPKERYQLNWPGKKEALLTANAPIAKTLRPCREESVDFDTTENLFIEGDNLDALKLLQETYLGKVKMIYIDPPYNTGKDFIYADNFAESTDEYLRDSGQKDDEGYRLVANTDSNGRFHSDWLSMIYPRLKLARNLLTDDGAIFISIDDSELENIKKLCDEIFGEENFINTVSVKLKNVAGASGGGEDKRLKKNVEYILIYSKNYNSIKPFEAVYNLKPINELVEEYREEGKSWKYTSILYDQGERVYIDSTVDGEGNEIKLYKRVTPIFKSINQVIKEDNISEQEAYSKYGRWIFEAKDAQSSIRTRVIEAKKLWNIEDDVISIEYVPRSGRNKGKLYEQFYKGDKCRLFAWLRDVSTEVGGILYKKEMQGTYWDLVNETNNLTKEGGVSFKNGKKPLKLISRFLDMMSSKDMIVLDFFAGSGTTAHAVLNKNDEDGGNRKFVAVQLPEACDEKSEDFKIGYQTIAEISKERIRGACTKIKEENPEATDLDTGFRVLKIDSSNMNDVHYTPHTVSKGDLFNQVEHIKTERSSEDLLFQVMLDWGVNLSLPIRKETIEGKEVYFVNDDDLVACFDKGIDEALIKALAAKKPLRVVFRDDGFVSDSVKINVEQIFKQLAPVTDIKAI